MYICDVMSSCYMLGEEIFFEVGMRYLGRDCGRDNEAKRAVRGDGEI